MKNHGKIMEKMDRLDSYLVFLWCRDLKGSSAVVFPSGSKTEGNFGLNKHIMNFNFNKQSYLFIIKY
jgi:hypothetical protein